MFRNIMIEKPAGSNGAHRKAVFWKSHIWSGRGARGPPKPNRRGGTHFFGQVLSAPIAKTPTQDAPIVARPHVVGYMLP